MIRAGVFIGVDKTGDLQKLNDAADGARRMYEWAIAQGMTDPPHAKLITDAGGKKVYPDLISEAIEAIIDGAGVEQLIVYFAGHGVNNAMSERWLLTDAPERTGAAVNVKGSVELAGYCGIKHVVIISDACRVAPEGIQAQRVLGVEVFPNGGMSGKPKPVDQFFACTIGMTAAELKDPATAAGNYAALYTNALLDALSGVRPDVLEPSDDAGDSAHYVKPLKLKGYLEREIPRRVKELKLEHKVNQEPDAQLLSLAATDVPGWLARIDTGVAGRVMRGRGTRGSKAGVRRTRGVLPLPSPPPENLRNFAQKLVRSAAEGNQMVLEQQLQHARTLGVTGAEGLAVTAELVAAPFGPDHFETECGIKVRGARIVEFFAPRARAELLGDSGNILRITDLEDLRGKRINLSVARDDPSRRLAQACTVLLRFGSFGTVVPAIPGFLAALTFDDSQLVDVAYEPSVGTERWNFYEYGAAEARALRAVAASASQHGRFRLEEEDAMKVAQKMQNAKGIDPSFAVYAAYAYHDLQAIDRLREMSGYLRRDVGVTLFDLELLSRNLINKPIKPNAGIVPFVPLLSQGWALLGAHRVRLHRMLAGIQSTMRDSLWSLFDEAGLRMLRKAMETKEVR